MFFPYFYQVATVWLIYPKSKPNKQYLYILFCNAHISLDPYKWTKIADIIQKHSKILFAFSLLYPMYVTALLNFCKLITFSLKLQNDTYWIYIVSLFTVYIILCLICLTFVYNIFCSWVYSIHLCPALIFF